LISLILLAFGLRIWRLDILPPGLYFDEAFDGWDARRIAFEGYHPVYFAANNGREPLFIYLLALSVRLFGPTAYAVRLVSALAGTLTVPAVYVAARAILRPIADQLHDRTHSPLVAALPALVAAAAIAVSYWHLSLSRLAFRVVLLPFLSALAMAWFWRAWHGRRRRDYVWSGALFALAFLAYISARFLPLVGRLVRYLPLWPEAR
jgi:4-amino-4-deoxy-L-arabinose transferase-like glycosyltransferase